MAPASGTCWRPSTSVAPVILSARADPERELIRFGAPATRVVVNLSHDGHQHELAVGFQPGSPKHMTADGAQVDRLADVQDQTTGQRFLPPIAWSW